ncbi:MAG TPA: hypothetical protein VF406_07440 [Thermodesulfobacteriota bacterium]
MKGRRILTASPGQRISRIDIEKEWDGVLLVVMNSESETTAVYEARRAVVVEALLKPGLKARNERGSLNISQFKAIGRLVWKQRV